MIIKIRLEQTPTTEYRMDYLPDSDDFIETKYKYLLFERGFTGYYGWIIDTGTPPGKHLDVIFLSNENLEVGDITECKIIGYYKRNDNDHKIVGIPLSSEITDISELPKNIRDNLDQIYDKKYKGEAWLGRMCAEKIYSDFTQRL